MRLTALEQQGEKGQTQIEWFSQTSTLIRHDDLVGLVQELESPECLTLPKGANRVWLRDLDGNVRLQLEQAVVDLICAYAVDTPEAIQKYMEARGESIRPEMIDVYRSVLVEKHGVELPALNALPNEQLFRTWWENGRVSSHWRGIVLESSCLIVWKSGSVPPDRIRDSLAHGPDQKAYWDFTYVRARHFQSPAGHSLEDEHRSRGNVLLADFSILIEHDEELMGDRIPYLFRFWYDSQDALWHPLHLSCVAPHGSPIAQRGYVTTVF